MIEVDTGLEHMSVVYGLWSEIKGLRQSATQATCYLSLWYIVSILAIDMSTVAKWTEG